MPALVIIAVTALGAALRLAVADQSVFADELSTYWIVSGNGLGGVVSTVHTDAEITPPLYFVAAWLTTRIDLSPELLRAPSLLAGTAAIPLTYLLGLRTVGRGAALAAATVMALAPFMVFYSAEARGYGVAVVLVLLSTLALLAAVDRRSARWWVVYGACSCAAVYTHYTVVFALATQLMWLLWAHPEARRWALLANAGAVVAFLPWLSGLINDFTSPTTDILDALSAFDIRSVRISLQHWSVGYPFVFADTGLRELPGVPALVLLGVGMATATAGVALRWMRERPRVERRVLLIVALALSAPVGEALVSAFGSNIFGARNLAVSWPGLALALGALLLAAGPRLRLVAAALVIGSFAIGALKMLDARFQRPDYEAAGAFIERASAPGDVILDGAVASVTPGPLSGLDVVLSRPHRVFRLGAPQQRDHPFTFSDPVLPDDDVIRAAVAAAGGERIFLVTGATPITPTRLTALPRRYRRVELRTFPGALRLAVQVYAARASPRG